MRGMKWEDETNYLFLLAQIIYYDFNFCSNKNSLVYRKLVKNILFVEGI